MTKKPFLNPTQTHRQFLGWLDRQLVERFVLTGGTTEAVVYLRLVASRPDLHKIGWSYA